MIKSHNEGSLPDKEEGRSNARKQTLLRKGGTAVAEKNYVVVEYRMNEMNEIQWKNLTANC